jgi:flagellum-specific ATP synthase
VEGDDTNEPIADTVRGILDGHIVMDRKIAERGRFPAINILRSVSRTMPDCNSNAETSLVMMARQMLTTYDDMAEMVRLGAYRKGTDAEVDRAIHYYQPLEKFLTQNKHENTPLAESYAKLAAAMDISPWPLVGNAQ